MARPVVLNFVGGTKYMSVMNPKGTLNPRRSFDAAEARLVLLQVISQWSGSQDPNLQAGSILFSVADRLGMRGHHEEEQAILTLFYDLFRSGLVAPGYNLSNPTLPFFHLTERGRETLKHASRDPANPDGYLANLLSKGSVDPIAHSYVDEALRTYNSGCYKAAAVMVGAATERVVLVVAEELVQGINRTGVTPPKNLTDWRYKTVRDAVTAELNANKKQMPSDLYEAFSAYWIPLTEQPRVSRNDAGHPVDINPVTPEAVHASLLIFPELISLATRLTTWMTDHYK